MGTGHHPLPAQAHHRREELVVREGGRMTLCKKHSKHLCWACILEARPDLEPPGFRETVQQIKEDRNHDQNDECLQASG